MARRPQANQPTTAHFWPAGDDLPLFAGATYGPRDSAGFAPPPAASQPSLLDLRPTFGAAEPTYTPIEEPHP